ncbi:MAG: transposase [Rhodococcus sp. (in: high G+C Gram-positive bacteria)]|uniref:transposase n=1 Tax=Rhodococcus sp. BS-15 TaxID=1304954 RepID=UPI001651894F|nr:transposase [Rhodococcus sp. BS-15]
MSRKRRSFATVYKVEAARRVIDSGRTIAEVARELGINETLLGRWVADERRRIEAAAASGDQLTAAERTELVWLRRQVSEQEKDIVFLKKRPRTSQPINKSRALRVDGRGVREFRCSPDGRTARGVDLRLLQTPRTQRDNQIGAVSATTGRSGDQDP